MIEMLISAFIVGVVVAIPPGSVSIETGRRAITSGFRAAITFNLGSLSADALYAILVYVGVSSLVAESDLFRLGLWIIGGSWLIWLGWDAIKSRLDVGKLNNAAAPEAFWRGYWAGVGITLLNPLTVLGWISLAGNFFATAWQDSWGDVDRWGWFAIVMMLTGVTVYGLCFITFFSRIRHAINPRGIAVISAGAGMFLIFFGLRSWWLAAVMLLG